MRPGGALHVFELIEATDGAVVSVPVGAAKGLHSSRGALHEPPDHTALVAYRRRIEELRRDHSEAVSAGVASEIQSLRAELEKLGDRFAPEIERARKAVGSRLRSTLSVLLDESPELGRHFVEAVELGTLCTYSPNEVPDWKFDTD